MRKAPQQALACHNWTVFVAAPSPRAATAADGRLARGPRVGLGRRRLVAKVSRLRVGILPGDDVEISTLRRGRPGGWPRLQPRRLTALGRRRTASLCIALQGDGKWRRAVLMIPERRRRAVVLNAAVLSKAAAVARRGAAVDGRHAARSGGFCAAPRQPRLLAGVRKVAGHGLRKLGTSAVAAMACCRVRV